MPDVFALGISSTPPRKLMLVHMFSLIDNVIQGTFDMKCIFRFEISCWFSV